MPAYQVTLDGRTVRTSYRVKNPAGGFTTFSPSSYEDEWTAPYGTEWTMIVALEEDGTYSGNIRDDVNDVYYRGVTAGANPSDVARRLIAETVARA